MGARGRATAPVEQDGERIDEQRIHLAAAGPRATRGQPRQHLGAAESRDDVQVDLRLAELGAARGHTIGARHLQLVAAAERVAVDGGDHRRLRARDATEQPLGARGEGLDVLGPGERPELTDVGAGHEHRAAAGEDDRGQVGLALQRVEGALELVERGRGERVGGRRVERHQRHRPGSVGADGVDAHAHGAPVEEAGAPGLVDGARRADAVEGRGGADAHGQGAGVPVLVNGLVGLGELLPGVHARRVDHEGAAVDQPHDLVGLLGVGEMTAQDREAGEQHALAVHPHVGRVEREAIGRSVFEIDDDPGEWPRQERADAERVLPRPFDDDVGVAARVVGRGQQPADRLAERLQRHVLVPAIAVGVAIVVRHRLRPLQSGAARERLEAHHARHAMRGRHARRARVVGHHRHHPRAGGERRRDRLAADGVGAGPTVDEDALHRAQAGAPEHVARRRRARLAEEGQGVAGGGAVEHEPAAGCEQLDHPAEQVPAHRGHDDVDQRAVVGAAHQLQQLVAGGPPAGAGLALARHRREGPGHGRIRAVDKCGRPAIDHQPALGLGRDEARRAGAPQHRARHRVEPGAAGGALDEDASADLEAGDVVERLVDGLEIQHVRRAGRECEALRMGQQLRRLAAHELAERAVGCLVALDPEIGLHRVGAGARRQQVGDARVEHTQLADLEPALPRRLTPQGRDEHDRATARHVQILVVQVEDGDRHAARGEDRVVREAGVEHVADRLVGTRRRHRQRHADQRRARLVVGRPAPAVLHHRPRVLARGQRIEAGTERRADRERARVLAEPVEIELGHPYMSRRSAFAGRRRSTVGRSTRQLPARSGQEPPSSCRTSRAPAPSARSLPRATARGKGTMPQLVHG